VSAEAHERLPGPAAVPPPRDIVVVSDLHLGRGYDPASRRFHRLEAFFYDDDFRSFVRWTCDDAARRGVPLALVLNGDVFDLLRIEPDVVTDGSREEKRFGPLPTPAVAGRMIADVLAGHPTFVEALADVLQAGQELVLVSGNHDLELQWPQVQGEVRRAVAAALERRGAGHAIARLRFEPWFVHEPGRIWIEHGCQYDPENAFRFHLRTRLAGSPAVGHVTQRDMPLGNFFQKYLYNAFGSISFIVPSSRANYRYFRFLLANQPRLLVRVARSQGRFLVELLRRMARPWDPAAHRAAQVAHEAELEELAERSGLGERLRQIDGFKFRGMDTAHAVSGMVRQGVKLGAGALGAALLVIALLSASSHAIESLKVGLGLKAVLSLLLYFTFATLAAVALVAAAIRLPRDGWSPRPLRQAAERIATLLDVPLVTFGHTHEEVVSPIRTRSGTGWYFNTGTWLAVFPHDVLIPRASLQYTFLRVRGHDAELLQWSPGRERPMPVVLFADEPSSGGEAALDGRDAAGVAAGASAGPGEPPRARRSA
jgi:UDP-2,3-diacylglucosamine pyrophosphatase LpxH